MADTIHWDGQSGKRYEYYIYRLDAQKRPRVTFQNAPGNYIFARETTPSRYRPIYVGESQDLYRRLAGHEQVPCLTQHGATHVHVHLNRGGINARRSEEDDIVSKWSPACNATATQR